MWSLIFVWNSKVMAYDDQVLTRFVGLKEISGNLPKFFTKVVEKDEVEVVVQHMITGFILDEPICKHTSEFFLKIWRD